MLADEMFGFWGGGRGKLEVDLSSAGLLYCIILVLTYAQNNKIWVLLTPEIYHTVKE